MKCKCKPKQCKLKKPLIENITFWAIVVALILAIMQILFTIEAPCKWLDAVWEPGDLLTLIGTLTLGYVSIRQTNRANQMSQRLLDIEANRYKMEIRPFAMVTNWTVRPVKCSQITAIPPEKLFVNIGEWEPETASLGLVLTFQNTTSAFLSLTLKSIEASDVSFCYGTFNQGNQKLWLSAGQEKDIVFFASCDFLQKLNGKTIHWKFILENRFGERYQESFDTVVLKLASYNTSSSNWYCSLAPQNFAIGKFVKTAEGKIELKMED